MISVLNRLPRSSGNNIIFASLTLILFFASCTSTKTVMQKQQPKNKVVIEKPQEQNEIQKIDTIVWTEVSEEEAPPIINETPSAPGLDKKSQYNISLLMPMNANKLSSSAGPNPDLDDNKFINFYAGAMIAFELLEKSGVNLSVDVYDTKSDNLDNLMSGYELRNSDLIIGPRDTDDLKKVAQFGKEREISIISPWKASSTITSQNPYYIQLIPGLYDHYYKIADHAAENFDSDQVVLIGRNNADRRRFKYFQQDDPFQEFMVNEDSLMVGETAFDSLMIDVTETTAFIIPNYSSKDERFIYNCLRRLNIEKGMKNVVVYGMPIMKDSDRTTYNFYTSLNMHICLSKFVDTDDQAIVNFERAYYDRYAALPTTDAYDGFDVMTYIGVSLDKYGKNFQFHLEEDDEKYLQTSYELEKVFKSEDLDKENFENINYYGNKHLDIITFQQKSFKRLRE